MSIEDVIRERGPMTVAAFMDLALYDPQFGYYARAPQRSGRAGDFFTSVDVGPLFGELLAVQLAEMFGLLEKGGGSHSPGASTPEHDARPLFLVEAGAGNGRLSADILRATRTRDRALYDRVRLHLTDASPEARRAQPQTLGDLSDRLVSSSDTLPQSFEGILIANELLDALPTHQVVMREEGLREIYVNAVDNRQSTVDRRLAAVEGPPSTPALAAYLARAGARLEPGWRGEISLRTVEWLRDAARRLKRGFMILIDYGHEARHLYSVAHAGGTLTTFSAHTMTGPEMQTPGWLARPGEQDLTAHVDFTSVRAAAEEEGLVTLGFMDQTYFLLALVGDTAPSALRQRLALKTLTMPGGLGSTHKVLIFGKDVGAPPLRGCSFRQRVT